MASSIRDKLIGAWRLVGTWREEVASGRRVELFGSSPRGLVIYTPSGHMSAIITASQPPSTADDAGRAAVHKTMVAYSGRYEVVGDACTTTSKRRGSQRRSATRLCAMSCSTAIR